VSEPAFVNLTALDTGAEELSNGSTGRLNNGPPKEKEDKTMTNERSTLAKKKRLKAEARKRWTAEAKKHLLGHKIIGVRWMTDREQKSFGWSYAAVVLLLDNGTLLWPSTDDEGNNAGALFGISQSGEDITLPVLGEISCSYEEFRAIFGIEPETTIEK
jgi:hypothetical protein